MEREKIGHNRIYNMDFREGMERFDFSEVKLVATDPPYNIKFKYNEYKDNMTQDEYIEMMQMFKGMPAGIISYPEETMRYLVPALGAPEEVVACCYNSNLPRQFRLINFYNVTVDFNKVKQPYKNPNDKRVKKLIENGSQGTRMYAWFSDIQLVKNVSKEKTQHPCPVPVALMERIIRLTTEPGDLVLDPFIGSGTTAVACINTGRRYVGFEIDRKYCELAEERIADTYSQCKIII